MRAAVIRGNVFHGGRAARPFAATVPVEKHATAAGGRTSVRATVIRGNVCHGGRAARPFAAVVPVEKHATAKGGPSVCSAKMPVVRCATVCAKSHRKL